MEGKDLSKMEANNRKQKAENINKKIESTQQDKEKFEHTDGRSRAKYKRSIQRITRFDKKIMLISNFFHQVKFEVQL